MNESSFFKTESAPYYIYTIDYTQNFAGVRVLHYLCHALNELGAEAYLVGCSKESETLRTPLLRESDVIRHQQSELIPIMLYPEVVSGNPLNMPYIVRWLLNQPGHVGGDGIFNDTDLVFAYSEDFMQPNLPVPLLRVPVVDDSVFNNVNNPNDKDRQGNCFYAHKYLDNGGELTEHVKGATSLCQDVKLTPKEIAAILRSSEFLYCYEPSSIISEALLCGCPVIMISTPYLEQLGSQDLSGIGMALDVDSESIERAKKSVGKMVEKIKCC